MLPLKSGQILVTFEGHFYPASATFLPERDYVMFGYWLSQIRLSSVTFVHPTLGLKLQAIFVRRFVPQPSFDLRAKYYRDHPMGTFPSGSLNTRGYRYLCPIQVSLCQLSFLYQIVPIWLNLDCRTTHPSVPINMATGVSRLPVLDCGTTFHPGFDGQDFRSTLLDNL